MELNTHTHTHTHTQSNSLRKAVLGDSANQWPLGGCAQKRRSEAAREERREKNAQRPYSAHCYPAHRDIITGSLCRRTETHKSTRRPFKKRLKTTEHIVYVAIRPFARH